MAFLRKNFASGVLASECASEAVTLTMTGGHTLPTNAGTFRLVIWDAVTYPDPADDSNVEIVTAEYSETPNVYNITRAQEDTADVTHAAGSKVSLNYTAGVSEDDIDIDYTDVSGNDENTDVTGAELEELTDGSETTLHSHAGAQSGCSVYRNTSVQSIPNTTYTKVEFNAELFDTLGEFDSTSNFRFTATTAGLYLITSTLRISDMGADDVSYIAIYKNGVATFRGQCNYPTAISHRPSITAVIQLVPTDYIEIYVYHDYGEARDLYYGITESSCTIVKIR